MGVRGATKKLRPILSIARQISAGAHPIFFGLENALLRPPPTAREIRQTPFEAPEILKARNRFVSAHKALQSREVVRADNVHSGVEQQFPGIGPIGRVPKTNRASL